MLVRLALTFTQIPPVSAAIIIRPIPHGLEVSIHGRLLSLVTLSHADQLLFEALRLQLFYDSQSLRFRHCDILGLPYVG